MRLGRKRVDHPREEILSDQIGDLAMDLCRRGDVQGAALCHSAAGSLLSLEERSKKWEDRYRSLISTIEMTVFLIAVGGGVLAMMAW